MRVIVNDKETILKTLEKISPDEISGLKIVLNDKWKYIDPAWDMDDKPLCLDNEICECLFDASLHRRITSMRWNVRGEDEPIHLTIETSECEDETTNIDADVIEALCELMRCRVEYVNKLIEEIDEIDEDDDYELGYFPSELECP